MGTRCSAQPTPAGQQTWVSEGLRAGRAGTKGSDLGGPCRHQGKGSAAEAPSRADGQVEELLPPLLPRRGARGLGTWWFHRGVGGFTEGLVVSPGGWWFR